MFELTSKEERLDAAQLSGTEGRMLEWRRQRATLTLGFLPACEGC